MPERKGFPRPGTRELLVPAVLLSLLYFNSLGFCPHLRVRLEPPSALCRKYLPRPFIKLCLRFLHLCPFPVPLFSLLQPHPPPLPSSSFRCASSGPSYYRRHQSHPGTCVLFCARHCGHPVRSSATPPPPPHTHVRPFLNLFPMNALAFKELCGVSALSEAASQGRTGTDC